jgi:hypothetical protein
LVQHSKPPFKSELRLVLKLFTDELLLGSAPVLLEEELRVDWLEELELRLTTVLLLRLLLV